MLSMDLGILRARRRATNFPKDKRSSSLDNFESRSKGDSNSSPPPIPPLPSMYKNKRLLLDRIPSCPTSMSKRREEARVLPSPPPVPSRADSQSSLQDIAIAHPLGAKPKCKKPPIPDPPALPKVKTRFSPRTVVTSSPIYSYPKRDKHKVPTPPSRSESNSEEDEIYDTPPIPTPVMSSSTTPGNQKESSPKSTIPNCFNVLTNCMPSKQATANRSSTWYTFENESPTSRDEHTYLPMFSGLEELQYESMEGAHDVNREVNKPVINNKSHLEGMRPQFNVVHKQPNVGASLVHELVDNSSEYLHDDLDEEHDAADDDRCIQGMVSPKFQRSRSPLLSPGASPRIMRRDDLIYPPPIPPRKISPAPSPPSTPALSHRSMPGGCGDVGSGEDGSGGSLGILDYEDDPFSSVAPPRTLSSGNLTSLSNTSLSLSSLLSASNPGVTTPTSPPRSLNTSHLMDSITGCPDPGRRGCAPSPLRHRPLSVPHIMPRSSKLRASGSIPSLSTPSIPPSVSPSPLSPVPPTHILSPSPIPLTPITLNASTVGSPQTAAPSLPSPSPSPSSSSNTTLSEQITVITYTAVTPAEEPLLSPPFPQIITPRPRTILSTSCLLPPTPTTSPSPSSPSSLSSCSSTSGSSSSLSIGDPSRRPSASLLHQDLEDIREEPTYENTSIQSAFQSNSAKKSATESELPTYPAPNVPSSMTKSISADRGISLGASDDSGNEMEGDVRTPYENLHVDYLAQLRQEGFAREAVIRALVITRNDIDMARDILREFVSKRS